MNIRTIATPLLLALAASCSTTTTSSAPALIGEDAPSRAYHASANIPSHGVALEGYCPVAYFAVGKPVRGQAQFSSDHGGIGYWFASADAKALFDADPDKYVPAYGGWCAFGMAVQDKFPVDPRNYKIENGRLLLFLKNENVDARELWNDGDMAGLSSKADAHWRKVQG